MRILITGSRDWTNIETISAAIMGAAEADGCTPDMVTIVHGGAIGADSMAAEYAEKNGYNIEEHPVVWRPYGIYNPRAGLARNSDMVNLGADACLAFIRNGSRGASDCARKAEAAGIPTSRYEA